MCVSEGIASGQGTREANKWGKCVKGGDGRLASKWALNDPSG